MATKKLKLKFLGHKLKKVPYSRPEAYTVRIGKGYKAWDVEVYWVPGGVWPHGSEQEYDPTWRATITGSTKLSTAGVPTAAKALKALERSVKAAYEELGTLLGK